MQHCAHVGKPSLAGLVWKTGDVSESIVPSPSYIALPDTVHSILFRKLAPS